jgi:multidrug resistance efflux pump
MRRPKIETARAALRLAMEDLVRADDLAKELYVTKETIRRWGNRGRCGIYLDTVIRGDGILYTSREALKRFQKASEAKAEAKEKAGSMKGGAA